MSNKLSLEDRLHNFMQEDIELLKTKRGHGYNYAPLEEVVKVVKPYLKKHGIGFNHKTTTNENNDKPVLITKLFNVDDKNDFMMSDTVIDTEATIAKMNKFMVVGSAMTYYRRYHLTVMLGLTIDEDDDAGGSKTAVTTTKSTYSNKGGRSVQNNPVDESTTDINYVEILGNYIKRGKSKEQVEKMYNNYKSEINEKDRKEIELLITKIK